MLYFYLLYILNLFAFLSYFDIVFFTEEILIALCMCLVFFLLFRSMNKILTFMFHSRTEFIYTSFKRIFALNFVLIDKTLAVLDLLDLRAETSFLLKHYSLVNNFFLPINSFLTKLILMSNKSFILSCIYSLHVIESLHMGISFNFFFEIPASKELLIEGSMPNVVFFQSYIYFFYLDIVYLDIETIVLEDASLFIQDLFFLDSKSSYDEPEFLLY